MSHGSSSKKDPAVTETGRPFRPCMFEAVLKNFSPDVPNTLSGRPRFVTVITSFSTIKSLVVCSLLFMYLLER